MSTRSEETTSRPSSSLSHPTGLHSTPTILCFLLRSVTDLLRPIQCPTDTTCTTLLSLSPLRVHHLSLPGQREETERWRLRTLDLHLRQTLKTVYAYFYFIHVTTHVVIDIGILKRVFILVEYRWHDVNVLKLVRNCEEAQSYISRWDNKYLTYLKVSYLHGTQRF